MCSSLPDADMEVGVQWLRHDLYNTGLLCPMHAQQQCLELCTPGLCARQEAGA